MQQKKSIEKSLNALVLIIALLSFGLVGSLVYENNITDNENKINNQITGQVTGLERMSGF